MAEGAASLSPISGIDNPNVGIIVPTFSFGQKPPQLFVAEKPFDFVALLGEKRPKPLAERQLEALAVHVFLGQRRPTCLRRTPIDFTNGLRLVEVAGFVGWRVESGFILVDHRFQNLSDGQAREVGNHSCGGKRETEPDQVMGGIADHGLIKVAGFDFELPIGVGDRAQLPT